MGNKLKRFVAFTFLLFIGISLVAQDKSIEKIRSSFVALEKRIQNKELVETKIDFDANGFPYDGVPWVISFWTTPYSGITPLKISTYRAMSLIGTETNYYYNDNQKCYFIYQKVNNSNTNSMDEYRLYFESGKFLQMIVTNSSNNKEKSRITLKDVLDEKMENKKAELIDLASKFLDYFRNIGNIPNLDK